jgi:hypothetical protein
MTSNDVLPTTEESLLRASRLVSTVRRRNARRGLGFDTQLATVGASITHARELHTLGDLAGARKYARAAARQTVQAMTQTDSYEAVEALVGAHGLLVDAVGVLRALESV